MWSAIKAWCERVIYCHHNARVLADMEWRMSDLLDHATGGRMSKAYYASDVMERAVDDHVMNERNDAWHEALSAKRKGS